MPSNRLLGAAEKRDLAAPTVHPWRWPLESMVDYAEEAREAVGRP